MDYFELENKIIQKLKTLLILIPVITFISSIGSGAFSWLKYGFWQELTSCGTLNLFCFNNTEFIGVNTILDWVGRNDITFLVAAACFIIFNVLPEE